MYHKSDKKVGQNLSSNHKQEDGSEHLQEFGVIVFLHVP